MFDLEKSDYKKEIAEFIKKGGSIKSLPDQEVEAKPLIINKKGASFEEFCEDYIHSGSFADDVFDSGSVW